MQATTATSEASKYERLREQVETILGKTVTVWSDAENVLAFQLDDNGYRNVQRFDTHALDRAYFPAANIARQLNRGPR